MKIPESNRVRRNILRFLSEAVTKGTLFKHCPDTSNLPCFQHCWPDCFVQFDRLDFDDTDVVGGLLRVLEVQRMNENVENPDFLQHRKQGLESQPLRFGSLGIPACLDEKLNILESKFIIILPDDTWASFLKVLDLKDITMHWRAQLRKLYNVIFLWTVNQLCNE